MESYTPDQVRHWGLEPYAIYGGKVASFKCSTTGDKVFPIELLPEILQQAHNAAIEKTMGPHWEYEDSTGVVRTGQLEKLADYGGTDITYFFRRDTGQLDLVSGSRLKRAKRICN